MPLTVIQCPDCDAKLKSKPSSAPRKVRCPKCGTIFKVGGEEELPELDAEEEAPPRKTTKVRRQAEEDTEPEEPPRKSRRRPADDDEDTDARGRQDDDDTDPDEAPRKSRRRQADDDEEDDEAPRRAATLQLWLGVGSLSLAVIVLLAVWIPAFASIALPLSGAALALGLIGLTIAIIKGIGHAFPVAGCEVSGIALVVSVLFVFVIPEALRDFRENAVAERPQNRNRAKEFPGQEQNPFVQGDPEDGLPPPLEGAPTRPAGTLTLTNGVAQVNGRLADSDPNDRALEDSPCKVYTVNMTAGRTYRIDLTSTDFDAFLRLEDAQGKQVAEDDDGGGDLNSRIAFTCQRDGRYRVVVTTLDDIGSFRLRVQEK